MNEHFEREVSDKRREIFQLNQRGECELENKNMKHASQFKGHCERGRLGDQIALIISERLLLAKGVRGSRG